MGGGGRTHHSTHGRRKSEWLPVRLAKRNRTGEKMYSPIDKKTEYITRWPFPRKIVFSKNSNVQRKPTSKKEKKASDIRPVWQRCLFAFFFCSFRPSVFCVSVCTWRRTFVDSVRAPCTLSCRLPMRTFSNFFSVERTKVWVNVFSWDTRQRANFRERLLFEMK